MSISFIKTIQSIIWTPIIYYSQNIITFFHSIYALFVLTKRNEKYRTTTQNLFKTVELWGTVRSIQWERDSPSPGVEGLPPFWWLLCNTRNSWRLFLKQILSADSLLDWNSRVFHENRYRDTCHKFLLRIYCAIIQTIIHILFPIVL